MRKFGVYVPNGLSSCTNGLQSSLSAVNLPLDLVKEGRRRARGHHMCGYRIGRRQIVNNFEIPINPGPLPAASAGTNYKLSMALISHRGIPSILQYKLENMNYPHNQEGHAE